MEISGKVVSVLPEQTGNGKNGVWRKSEFILETTAAKFPKKVCISVWGEKIDQFSIKEGQTITASIEVESREYNSRWYTDVKAWKIEKQQEGAGAAPAREIPATAYTKAEIQNSAIPEQDLPF